MKLKQGGRLNIFRDIVEDSHKTKNPSKMEGWFS
jgi:hypothetical protein